MQRNRYEIKPPKQVFKAFIVFLSIMLLVTVILQLITAPAESNIDHVPLSSTKIRLINDVDNNGKISKGDCISICGLDYDDDSRNDLFRVMDIDENKYKLLAIDSVYSSAFNNSYKMKKVNGKYISKYENSNIDKYSDIYFQNLSEDIQKAIVPEKIEQSVYQFDYGNDEITKKCEGKYLQLYESSDAIAEAYVISQEMNLSVIKTGKSYIGERYVYAPDIDDIQELFNNQKFSVEEFRNFLFNKKSTEAKYIATRTVIDQFPDRIGALNRVTGNYTDLRTNVALDFHPEFVIEIQN